MAHRAAQRMQLLEADSSSTSSSSSSEDSSVLSSSSSSEADYSPQRPLQSLDDLPSDDSVSLGDSSSDEEDGSSDADGSDEEQNDMSLEERVQRQREAGISPHVRQATRERKSAALAAAKEALVKHKSNKLASEVINKKRSKHAPTEASSKRRDFYNRGAPDLNASGIGVEIGAHKYKPRDPRMCSMSGTLNEEHFEHNYEFLRSVRDDEIALLKKRIMARNMGGRKGQKLRRKMKELSNTTAEEDQAELTRLLQERSQFNKSQLDRTAKQAVKRQIRQDVALGKRGAYYLRKRDMRKLQAEAMFEELQKRGGDRAVDKTVAKRRKRLKSKDTKFMKES